MFDFSSLNLSYVNLILDQPAESGRENFFLPDTCRHVKLSQFLLVLKEEIKILKMGLERMLLESLIKSLDFKVAINIRYLSKRHMDQSCFQEHWFGCVLTVLELKGTIHRGEIM